MRVQLDSDKSRSKALKIAAQAQGVSSVSLEGEERDKLVVTGDVDALSLLRVLRKKFLVVTLSSVEEVKKKEDDKGKTEKKEVCYYHTPCPPPPSGPPLSSYCMVCDPYPSNCSIM